MALFRQYLTNQFAASQLVSWGVLASNAPLTAIANFDVRAYLLNVASNRYGLAGTNLASAAWLDSAWLTDPVWSAYKIFRRQNGSAALTNYDLAVHAAAVQAGETNFAFLVNDQLPSSGGWARGTLDLASTELSLGWNITAGARGFGLPPFARVSPVYKAVREQGRSHFVNVWLYNDGYAATLTNAGAGAGTVLRNAGDPRSSSFHRRRPGVLRDASTAESLHDLCRPHGGAGPGKSRAGRGGGPIPLHEHDQRADVARRRHELPATDPSIRRLGLGHGPERAALSISNCARVETQRQRPSAISQSIDHPRRQSV